MRIHSVPNGGGPPPSSLPHAEHRKFLDEDEDGENKEVGAAENGAAERVENEGGYRHVIALFIYLCWE